MTETSKPYNPVQSIEGLETQLRHLLIAKNELTKMFESQERSFALDGHLIGSIGEVICSYLFNLSLLPNSAEQFDAVTVDGKFVQIKISSNESFRFKKEHLKKNDNAFLLLLDVKSNDPTAKKLVRIRFVGTFEEFIKLNKRPKGESELSGYAAFIAKPSFSKEILTLRDDINLHSLGWIDFSVAHDKPSSCPSP
jgi:hypothetical protein